MNTSRIGNVAEAKVLAKFVEQDWVVLLPFGNVEPYDLVIDRGNGFEKIQVKNGRLRNGVVLFNAYSNTRAGVAVSYKGQADLFAVYAPELDKVFLVPVDESPTTTISLRVEIPKNNQLSGVRLANDYVLD